jgi:hypothetical protein
MQEHDAKNRDCGSLVRCKPGPKRVIRYRSAAKKWGSRLGPGAPRRRVPLSVSFSHRRVGSSILASLSEAGGNELQKMASKPLPPRSRPFTFRHVKRVYTPSNAIGRPSVWRPCAKLRPFLCVNCARCAKWLSVPKPRRQPISERRETESGITHYASPIPIPTG